MSVRVENAELKNDLERRIERWRKITQKRPRYYENIGPNSADSHTEEELKLDQK